MRIITTFDQPDWGSATRYGDDARPLGRVERINIHWGGGTVAPPDSPGAHAVLRGWQRFHMAPPREWSDIAYNYAVDQAGASERLRGWNRGGATSGDYDGDGIPENDESIAVVWVGGAGGQPPTPAAMTEMGRLVRDIMAEAGRTLEVLPHSAHKATACPGDVWRAWIDRKGWEDEMRTTAEWARTQRPEDIQQAADIGVLYQHEADYFIALWKRAKDVNDPLTWDYSEFQDLRNAIEVRSPLWV